MTIRPHGTPAECHDAATRLPDRPPSQLVRVDVQIRL